MISILKHAFQVRGYKKVPATSFPYQMGATNSDMFRVDVDHPTSLAEFHAAFLSSPLFQLEILLLSYVTKMDPKVRTPECIFGVATGEYSTYGPWSAWAVDGVKGQSISAASTGKNASSCQIMRCHVNGKAFCDTWWAVEKTAESETPELVFGTALKKSHWSSTLLDPVHRIYSRLLLGSAKFKLLEMRRVSEKQAKTPSDKKD
eukprot:CAMPEP_0117024460 /NCGR_PEP_ID=MMETSP0472-20121206/18167_1 /TAXON_ID=693140 ORGANISM="Tiarina fusus, Strain LIS" /NCGR_SAMPLE_ID=MMETSP0472 /ASSEMBLY_ACC=CAM_ASM_000603 /LENGTH=203 /DNA_ID=CAMNT_0004730905 /DNA_START=58 /DNA_END=669 /DNA_ORIENTATION=-